MVVSYGRVIIGTKPGFCFPFLDRLEKQPQSPCEETEKAKARVKAERDVRR
jgi:hypothetical protein